MAEEDRRKIRALVAKLGLDTHWRGAVVIAQALRDAGMEVIYTGTYQSPETVVRAAIEEDVDIIAMSFLGGSHKPLSQEVVRLLKEKDANDICLIAGGVIPDTDKPSLEEMGVTGNYGPGTPLDIIVSHIMQRVKRERWKQAVTCKDCKMFMPYPDDSNKGKCMGMKTVIADMDIGKCLNFQVKP